jgi:hypothetical protein
LKDTVETTESENGKDEAELVAEKFISSIAFLELTSVYWIMWLNKIAYFCLIDWYCAACEG